jgi:predicted ArsR family transcriptional regulator
MKTMRQRILGLLEVQRQATSAEIARALGLPAANVRYHLKILEDEGALQVIGERRQQGRGRPKRLYATSRQVSLNNYDTLCSVLLSENLQSLDADQLPHFLQHIAARLLQASSASEGSRPPHEPPAAIPAAAGKALASRLVAAVQRLNQLNYQSRWEAHTHAPRIIFTHCPYRKLVDNHPQLCQLDAALLESLLEKPVVQLEKLAQDRRGVVRCVFSL